MTDREFSDEEMARDWTLTSEDMLIVSIYHRNSRLFLAIQVCAVRLYGRFLKEMNHVSPRILNYLNKQLELPPSPAIEIPGREATLSNQRRDILNHLGFEKFGSQAEYMLITWIKEQAGNNLLFVSKDGQPWIWPSNSLWNTSMLMLLSMLANVQTSSVSIVCQIYSKSYGFLPEFACC